MEECFSDSPGGRTATASFYKHYPPPTIKTQSSVKAPTRKAARTAQRQGQRQAQRQLKKVRALRVDAAATCQQHMQQALVPMNVHLHLVVSDLIGETGLRILEAILQGEREVEALVKLRDPRCKKSTVAEMEAALKGHYTPEGLFVLQQSLDGWKFFQKQLQQCDE